MPESPTSRFTEDGGALAALGTNVFKLLSMGHRFPPGLWSRLDCSVKDRSIQRTYRCGMLVFEPSRFLRADDKPCFTDFAGEIHGRLQLR